METARNRDSMTFAAVAFGLSGRVDEAEQLIDEMTQRFPNDTIVRSVWIPLAESAIEIDRDNGDAVVSLLQKAAPYERAFLEVLFVRGRALGMTDRPAEAMIEFRKMIDLRGVDPTDPLHHLAYLGLARAHAAMGDADASRQEFQTFFSLLADADDGLPTLDTARREYAALP